MLNNNSTTTDNIRKAIAHIGGNLLNPTAPPPPVQAAAPVGSVQEQLRAELAQNKFVLAGQSGISEKFLKDTNIESEIVFVATFQGGQVTRKNRDGENVRYLKMQYPAIFDATTAKFSGCDASHFATNAGKMIKVPVNQALIDGPALLTGGQFLVRITKWETDNGSHAPRIDFVANM
jgi:hypothetical protein